MADSTFATFDSVSSLTFQDYLVGYRGIRETQINYTDFLKNTLQADLSSKQLISVYSTVNSLSDTWEESVYITPLQVASASWDSVYSTVKSLSDTWEESVYITPLQVASASWDSVYSTVNSNSSRYTTLDYLSTNNVLLSALTVAGNVSASGTIYATNIITNVSILSTDSTVITIDNSNFNTYLSKILHVRSASNTTINFETSLPEGFNVMILNETTYNVTLTSTANNIYLSFGSVLSGQQGAKQLYSSASVYKYGNNVYAIGALV